MLMEHFGKAKPSPIHLRQNFLLKVENTSLSNVYSQNGKQDLEDKDPEGKTFTKQAWKETRFNCQGRPFANNVRLTWLLPIVCMKLWDCLKSQETLNNLLK